MPASSDRLHPVHARPSNPLYQSSRLTGLSEKREKRRAYADASHQRRLQEYHQRLQVGGHVESDEGEDDDDGGLLADIDKEVEELPEWKGYIKEYRVKGTGPSENAELHPLPFVEKFLHGRRRLFKGIILKAMQAIRSHSLKVQFQLIANMILPGQENSEIEQRFTTFALPMLTQSEVYVVLKSVSHQLNDAVDEWMGKGSGWRLLGIKAVIIRTWYYQPNGMVTGQLLPIPLPPGSFMHLPDWIMNKKAVINPQNRENDLCFHYAMELARFCKNNAGSTTASLGRDSVRRFPLSRKTFLYSEIKQGRHIDLTFPMDVRNIPIFERINRKDKVAINVLLAAEDNTAQYSWVYHSKYAGEAEAWIVWLLITWNEGTGETHYSYVKNLQRLLAPDRTTSGSNSTYFPCERCLHSTRNEDALRRHQNRGHCQSQPPVRTVLPEPESARQCFRDYYKMLPSDYAFFLDFECFVAPTHDPTRPLDKQKNVHKHIPSEYGILAVSLMEGDDWYEYRNYQCKEADFDPALQTSRIGERAISDLLELRDLCVERIRNRDYPLSMSSKDEVDFQVATHCHICLLPFEGGYHPAWTETRTESYVSHSMEPDVDCGGGDDDNDVDDDNWDDTETLGMDRTEKKSEVPQEKCRDHDHRKQYHNYRGAAHSYCNLSWRTGWKTRRNGDRYPTAQWKIPVLVHNLRGYDAHLIVNSIKEAHHDVKRIHVIPNQGESFMSINFNNLQFIDSYSFLLDTLDGAVNNLKSDWEGRTEELPRVFKHLVQHCARKEDEEGRVVEPILHTDSRFPLLLQKGVFPYEYLDGPNKLSERSLPPRSAFHSTLTGEDISDSDYRKALHFWGAFNIQTLGEYQQWYMKLDVFLLAAAVLRMRAICIVVELWCIWNTVGAGDFSAVFSHNFALSYVTKWNSCGTWYTSIMSRPPSTGIISHSPGWRDCRMVRVVKPTNGMVTGPSSSRWSRMVGPSSRLPMGHRH